MNLMEKSDGTEFEYDRIVLRCDAWHRMPDVWNIFLTAFN